MRLAPTLSTILLLGAALAADAHAQCSASTHQLIDQRRFDDARSVVEAQLKRNERDDVALHCMGQILLEQDRPGDAVDWFEKAVDANDRVSAHHLWLGNALGLQARHVSRFKQPFLARRIKSEFEKAVQLDPTSVDAHHGLVQFYSIAPGVMGGSMEKAKEQAVEIEKLNAWRGHAELSRLLEQEKDPAGAEREASAAVAAAPDSTGAYNALASFYRRQKRWADAIGVYETVLKRKPDAVNAHLSLALTLDQAGGAVDRMERETRAWLAAPPADAPRDRVSEAHYLLGRCAERQGKKEAAKSEYQQALTLDPGNDSAKKALDGIS